MKKRIISSGIVIILMVFLSCFSISQETKETFEEKIYVVQIGDTLWGIAKKFYNNPFEWKKIHSANPEIKNPDLIYPGEKLVIPLEAVVPVEKIAPVEEVTPIEKITPVLEMEEKKVEISTVTVEVSAPLEEKKEIAISIDKYMKMKFTPGNFVVPKKWQFDGLLTGEKEKKILISAGDTVYLNIGSKKGLEPKMYYFVYRKGGKAYYPETGKLLGRNVMRIGLIEITETKENSSIARVITSSEAIEVGDGIKIGFEK